MTLQLHKPDGKGGIEPHASPERNWRGTLRSARWGQSRRDGRLPAMSNPEMNPTSNWMAVAFWVGLGVLTFVILVAGYGSGLWTFTNPVTSPLPGGSPLP